jgi:hypothetical protein
MLSKYANSHWLVRFLMSIVSLPFVFLLWGVASIGILLCIPLLLIVMFLVLIYFIIQGEYLFDRETKTE